MLADLSILTRTGRDNLREDIAVYAFLGSESFSVMVAVSVGLQCQSINAANLRKHTNDELMKKGIKRYHPIYKRIR
jgi:hypothetical protein